ncbi:acyloxyacyl hydrolase [Trichlorobacter sp.]|uniref:acyloxyacyl hydrolase n=1 Tax=Trichlorobacter sp. TaxID=2911007 RepID=UPI002612C268|nr:acyloxyacyl hydrolase [Trichlorobacter sp.]
MITALITSSALADDHVKTTADARYELTMLTGYGITHRGFGETRSQVQTWDAIARLGWYLSGDVGKGSWYQGRHQLLVELPYHLAVDHGGRSMVGGYLLGSWKFTSLNHVKPYIFAGGGPVYVDLGLPSMGAKLNFSYQGGTGMQIPLGQATMLNLEYRYHHISNAGTATPNEPLNSSKILVGVSWLY